MIKIIVGVITLLLIIFIYNYLQSLLFNKNNREYIYHQKAFMTESELNFYNKIKLLERDEYKIIPQVNLATIIDRGDKGYHNELFRNIDFAIFSHDFKSLLLLIELNDSSHKESSRKKRDIKVKNICNSANIKLITFYTSYTNQEDYVVNRIKKELVSIKNSTL